MQEQITGAKKIVSVIGRGNNQLGFDLARVLLKNGSKVIIIDEYSKSTKQLVTELRKHGEVEFVDQRGATQLYEKLERIDYSYYLLYDYLLTRKTLTSKDFLEESNSLNALIETTAKYDGAFSLITSIELNKQLALTQDAQKVSAYSNIEFQRYAESLTAEYYDKSNADVRIMRLGTILGRKYNLALNPTLYKLVSDAVRKSHIAIEGEGLDTHYIINSKDAIFAILKIAFAEKCKGEVVSIANDSEYNTLSLAYKILELNPTATNIQFIQKSDENRELLKSVYIPAPNATKYGWTQKESIEKTLANELKRFYQANNEEWKHSPLEDKEEAKSSARKTKKSVKRIRTPLGKIIDRLISVFFIVEEDFDESYKRRFNFLGVAKLLGLTTALALLFYFLIAPLLWVVISAALLSKEVNTIKTYASDYNVSEIDRSLERTQTYSKNIDRGINSLGWAFRLVDQEELHTNLLRISSGAKNGSSATQQLFTGISPLMQYLSDFEPAQNFDNSGNVTTTKEYRQQLSALEQKSNSIRQATNELRLVQSNLEEIDISLLPAFTQEIAQKYHAMATQYVSSAITVGDLAPYLPDLLGNKERKTYLFILQNEGEIRATGGWISSYAIIGIEGGQLRQLVVDDAYNIDGALINQGKRYEPPSDMSEALGVDSWTFSLANWNPDISASSTDLEFFIKESNAAHKIDGVIFINTELLKDLIESWEQIDIVHDPTTVNNPGQVQEIVTAENFDEKIFQMHRDYTPGSSLKSDFIVKLSDRVIKKLLSQSPSEIARTFTVLESSLEKKDLIINLKAWEISNHFEREGWTGKTDSISTSVVMPVDWNWGGNKANLFLNKNSVLTIQIDEQKNIQHDYELAITNSSQSSIYPEGEYKNYLRLYLPQNAKISSVSGFDGNNYSSYYENNFRVVGGFVTVPIRSTSSIKVQYRIDSADSDTYMQEVGQLTSFSTEIYKQPGDVDHNYRLSIFYPNSWEFERNSSDIQFADSQNLLTSDFSLKKDQSVRVYFKYR